MKPLLKVRLVYRRGDDLRVVLVAEELRLRDVPERVEHRPAALALLPLDQVLRPAELARGVPNAGGLSPRPLLVVPRLLHVFLLRVVEGLRRNAEVVRLAGDVELEAFRVRPLGDLFNLLPHHVVVGIAEVEALREEVAVHRGVKASVRSLLFQHTPCLQCPVVERLPAVRVHRHALLVVLLVDRPFVRLGFGLHLPLVVLVGGEDSPPERKYVEAVVRCGWEGVEV
mmetsp:Transcript_25861/g.62290  ORF Transcript_25861/g.62290 Transcript_25861/m.62290 type:complete len:227 (+) Transcript_25861:504-1184(+)